MKQLKKADARAQQGRYAADVVAPDSRPLKPPAGQQAHHRFPLAGGAAAAPAKPAAAVSAAAHPADGTGGRQAKAAAAAVDEKAGPALAARGHHPDGEHPAQQPRSGDGSGRPVEQYVRLRVRVRGDRLTVLDSHLVDGPLSAPTTLHGAGVYEVTVGDRLVHAAAIPDLGLEQRSFPNPEGPPDQHGHHFTEFPTTEISVRIPAGELTPETIGTVQVRLHRLVGPASGVRVGAQSLGVQLRDQVEPVAELVGLPESTLPEAIEARGGRTGQGR
jgi:hypothetical protein